MAGLLDFMNTPAGIGLLSAVAGGAATARRGTPINNLGRGLASGLSGYQTAQGQIAQDEENALARQFRQMQMEQIQNTLAQNKAQRAWREGLPGAMEAAKTKQMPFEADNPFGENLGQLSTVQQGDPQALQRYLMQPDSPYAERMVEKQLFPTQQDLMKVSAGETLIDPITRQPVYTAPAKQQDTFSQDMRDYLGAYGIDPASASREQLASAYQAVQGAKDRRASMSGQTVTLGTPQIFTTPEGQTVFVQPANRPGAAPQITALPKGIAPSMADKPPTEAENTAAGFLGRMRAAEELIGGIKGGESTEKTNIASALPVVGTYAERRIMTPEQQQYKQAADDWIRSKLRKESGAVIGADEMAAEYRTYFPQPGDTSQVIQQKAQARKQAEKQFEISAGRAMSKLEAPRPAEAYSDSDKERRYQEWKARQGK